MREYQPAPQFRVVFKCPGEEIRVRYAGSETKRVNDHTIMVYLIPSAHPKFEIQAPQGIAITLYQGTRSDIKLDPLGLGHWALRGTLLPYQVIEVRWWPVAQGSVGR